MCEFVCVRQCAVHAVFLCGCMPVTNVLLLLLVSCLAYVCLSLTFTKPVFDRLILLAAAEENFFFSSTMEKVFNILKLCFVVILNFFPLILFHSPA